MGGYHEGRDEIFGRLKIANRKYTAGISRKSEEAIRSDG